MINLNAMIAEVLRVPPAEITDNTSMDSTSAWDSISHIEIIFELEKKLAIVFNGDEIIKMTSVNKIKNLIFEKLGECVET